MLIAKHLPALQVLIPFSSALLVALSSKSSIARALSVFALILNSAISIYGILILQNNILSYNFGNWQAPIGIEYRLDYLNQPIIIYINCILLFCLTAGHYFIQESIIKFIPSNRQHLFYAILLFAHAGYIGIISTNDLFNLYVFIEISSLSTYVLMATGGNSRAVIGAFDYLMLGTIGATLILIGIGFILNQTGSLNISDIHQRLIGLYDSRIVIAAVSFILIGVLLKIAFFPMHFWMMRAYSSTPASILAYLGSISTIVGSYICIRFIYFVIEDQQQLQTIANFITPLALATIILVSWFATISVNIKKIVIYGAAAGVGYAMLLLTITSAQISPILYQLLFIDGLNKAGLFMIIAYTEVNSNYLSLIKRRPLLYSTIIGILFCSSGLPLSPMFIIKIKMLDLLISDGKWLEFFTVIIGSTLSLLYHYRIASLLLFSNAKPSYDTEEHKLHTKPYAFYLIIILQLITLPLL
ncbi:proton-conducting transporter transmembrane domain-containing protein [Candidatus Trichorickettsia mobilis]|uniref:proton-conducting transporter transmembrane domain-containing protein n=1 Tax=Candidatus Trichorickettsia mobilis TaxID=1346319 RepID=UPI0029301723|nr:proton-conducting transporter membrane subunit [Candidatus Trichorickettsia mobilis]